MVPIRRLSNAAKKRAAGSLRSNLHAAFSLALVAADEAEASEDMLGFGITRNPVTDIRPIRGGQGYNSPGDRVIPAAVLLAYREKLDAMPPGDMKDALRLHLLTGNRVEQLLASTVEGDNLVLMDTKGRREQARKHLVPLVGRVAEIVDARQGRAFHITSGAVGKRLKKMSGGYSIPDVRRTMETNLVRLGFSLDVTGELLSHGTTTGVQKRHYVRHDYRAEKIAALRAWEAWLSAPL